MVLSNRFTEQISSFHLWTWEWHSKCHNWEYRVCILTMTLIVLFFFKLVVNLSNSSTYDGQVKCDAIMWFEKMWDPGGGRFRITHEHCLQCAVQAFVSHTLNIVSCSLKINHAMDELKNWVSGMRNSWGFSYLIMFFPSILRTCSCNRTPCCDSYVCDLSWVSAIRSETILVEVTRPCDPSLYFNWLVQKEGLKRRKKWEWPT